MGQLARDADGNVFTSDDGQTWKPAPMAQDEKGGKFYNDGSAWQPVGGAAAGGNARPAAAAPRSSTSQPAAAPTAPRSSTSQPAAAPTAPAAASPPSYTPLADQAFGPRPDPMLAPGSPVATSLYNIARQAPYDIESSLHSSVDMFEHGRKALFEEGKPSGVVGMGAGFGSLFGAPSAPVFNALSQPLDEYATKPFEKMTGMPHEISDAAIFASPLLGMKGGRVPTARPMEGEVLPGDRGPPSGGRTPPPDIEGEVASPVPRLPAPEPPTEQPPYQAPNMSVSGMPRAANDVLPSVGRPRAERGPSVSDEAPAPVPSDKYNGRRWINSLANENNLDLPPEKPFESDWNGAWDEKFSPPKEAIDRSLKPMRDVLGLSDEKPLEGEVVGEGGMFYADTARRFKKAIESENFSEAESIIEQEMSDKAKAGAYKTLRAAGDQKYPPPEGGWGGPTQFNSGIDPKSLRAVIDPTGMDANSRQAESMIRDEIGMANRDTAITADLLEEHQRRVNMMTPVEKYDLFRYIQNRSNGFPINDPTLQGLADTMRDAFKERENKLRALPSTAQMGFYEDYLPQLVKDPKTFAGGGLGVKQGSGAFTKERFYETIDDLIAAGHELKTDNPIELTMDYVTNADRYIALNAVRDTAEAAGDIAYITDRRRVPDGWDKLQGRLGVKHTPGGQVQGYAPEGFARVFNNFVSRGATGDWKNIYDMAARTSNAIQALEFAASQYHAFTVAMKAPVVEIGRAFQAVRRGAPMTAAKALAEAPMASITTALKGRKAQQIYLRRPGVNASAADREVVNILTRANHRFKGLDPSKEYEYSAMRDYWRSWKRGALKTELLNDWANAKADPLVGAPKMIMRQVGRIIQTIAKPVFEHYIPQLKNGAAFGAMKQWLELHPGANAADKLKAARDIVDQVDNMMGEMVHDNIFWQRAQKQVAQLAMTSFSWTFGNARWVAGAAADAPKAFMPRGDLSLRTATLLAYPIVLGTLSAMLQYLMTGKPPDDVTDLIAPKTGGKVQSGRAMVDERLMIPGSHKDWLGWYFNPGQEFKNKLSRGLHIGADLASGTDHRDDPLSVAKPYSPQWFMDYFKYAAEEMLPIAAQQTAKGGKQGSHISDMARFIGFKDAPMYLQNPKGWQAWQASQASKATKTKIRHDKESERRYKGPVE